MRSRFLIPILALGALGFAPAGAAPSPCPGDSNLCAPTEGISASCRAVELFMAGMAYGDSDASITASEGYDFESNSATGTMGGTIVTPQGAPRAVITANVRGLPSECVAYREVIGPTTYNRGCARAPIGDAYISLDLKPTIPDVMVISAAGLVSQGCSSTRNGGPEPGLHDGDSGQVRVNGQAFYLDFVPPNTTVPLAPGFSLVLNEQFASSAAGCGSNQGAAMRLVGPGVSVILGWISTAACG